MTELSENALQVAQSRYFMEGENWEDCCKRVATAVAKNESSDIEEVWRDKFAEMIFDLKAIPGGRILRNAGSRLNKIFNCHVLELPDSIEGIGRFLHKALVLNAEGGGVGCNPQLRPKGAKIKGKGGTSTGILSFLEAISVVLNTVESGGNRRCLPEDSLIFTEDGLVKIKDIKPQVKVHTTKGLKKVKQIFDQGEQRICRITTDAGDFYATINHRMAVQNNGNKVWKEIGELKIEDTLLGFNQTVIGKETNLPKDFTECRPDRSTTCKAITIPKLTTGIAWLIGFCHGNGSVFDRNKNKHNSDSGSRVSLSTDSRNTDIIQKCVDTLSKFGIEAKAKVRDNENCCDIIARSQRLAEYFYTYIKKPATPIHIPDFILGASVDIRGAYLAGVIDSDGSVKTQPVNLVTTTYKEFSDELNSLYFSLGIPTRIKTQHRREDSWNTLYKVNLIGFYKRFNRFIGKYSCKKLPAQDKLTYGYRVTEDIVRSQLRDKDYRSKGIRLTNGYMNYESFLKCGGKIGYVPIRVISVEYDVKIGRTYDIEVEGAHEFYVNGLLTHNSGLLPILDISHPEIEAFIEAKNNLDSLNNFNISVGITNDFLDAVEQKEKWALSFAGEEHGQVWAADIFDKIIANMLVSGEPGIVNLDKMRTNNSWYFSPIESLNLCGELALSKDQSCSLGSLVLPSFITANGNTRWEELADTIQTLVRFLDNTLDVNNYSFPEMYEATQSCRRIGIGVMGLGDYLFSKKVRYGSSAGLDKTEELIKFMRNEIYKASIELAKEKGPFPGFSEWPYTRAKFVKKLPARIRMDIKKYGIRQCTSMAFAPSGTISLIANTTSGIEPLPMKAYIRKDRVGERTYIHPTYKELLLNKEDIPDHFVDAFDLSAEEHFETTVAIQRLNDSSISKTQLLPSGTKHEQLKEWILEYARDLIGITVYVDGSRKDQILNRLTKKEALKYINKETEDSLTVEDVQCARGTCEL